MSKRSEFLKLIQENITENEYEIIKEKYRSDVNSNRRFESISNIEDLLSVLEDRLILTSYDFNVLEFVIENIAMLKEKKVNVSDYFYEELNRPKLSNEDVESIRKKYKDSFRKFGKHLLVDVEEVDNCQNIDDVLSQFHFECRLVSPQEMKFRLNRAIFKIEKEGFSGF